METEEYGWEIIDPIHPDLIPAPLEEEVRKHQEHDQSTHGSWANALIGTQTLLGTTVTSLIDKLSEKNTPGFSIDLRTKTSPKDGFIASDSGAERALDWAKVSSSRVTLRNEIVDYVVDHAELLDSAGTFFGGWVEKGVLYLDVSRRYASRSEGIRVGFQNEQKAIYDVVNDSYIYMEDEVDERTNKARSSRSTETSQGNDPTGIRSLRRRNGGGSTGQEVDAPHICLGRYPKVEKHLEGQHDQSTHGSWASGRFGTDSLKSARDGAKEYAFKAGIEQDDSIDYQKTVANRARAARIADAYDELPVKDEKAFEAYTALATEVEAQFDYMTKTMGMKVEFVDEDPYKTSREMFADASKGSIKVLRTASTGSHPFFTDDQNDKFRAVHDFFGHAATGRGFGQDGEESAWVHHSQMFTMTARAALTTETRGQNSWYNTRGQGFAEQKVALLPEEFWQVPKTFEKSYKVIRFAPGLIPLFKHQEHDQSTHGNWATGSEVVTDLVAWRDSEVAKFGSDTDKELYFMDTILKHRVIGSMFTRAVDTYQSMLGYTMNEALRDPIISTDGVATTIALLDGAIEYAPPLNSPMTVYRGVKGKGLDFFESLKVGDVYSDKGFSSTSLDPAIGAKFANAESGTYQGIVLRMKLPAGTEGVFPASVTGIESQFSREAEFLLPRDSKFKVQSNQGKVWDVEVVND